MGYIAKPGYARNPLLKYPRNSKCPCDSGKKFKACHLKTMPAYVTNELAETYAKGMKQMHLIRFIEEPEQDPIAHPNALPNTVHTLL